MRVSALSGVGGLRWAALTERATVPERLVPVDTDLVRQLVDRLTEPSAEDARDLPDLLSRFVVPPDFQQLLTDEAAVLMELDQETALVPWEFLADVKQHSGERDAPLAVRTPLSRQLRTPYSRVIAEEADAGPLKALVIGDPGDPEKGFQLPGARNEALAVSTRLSRLGVEVTLFVGAANSSRLPGILPATRLDVLRVLPAGGHHIVHYRGHSSFDASASGVRSGWVFADGLLTAQELVQLERPRGSWWPTPATPPASQTPAEPRRCPARPWAVRRPSWCRAWPVSSCAWASRTISERGGAFPTTRRRRSPRRSTRICSGPGRESPSTPSAPRSTRRSERCTAGTTVPRTPLPPRSANRRTPRRTGSGTAPGPPTNTTAIRPARSSERGATRKVRSWPGSR